MDRRRHHRSILDAISFAALFSTLDGKYDGWSQEKQFIEGLRSKTLKLLEYGYWDYFSELHNEPAGWTVTDTTDRYGLRNPTLCQTSPSSFSSCTTLPPTDRHKHVGPSRIFVPKHLNSWNMGTGITSLNFMTNLQDGPS